MLEIGENAKVVSERLGHSNQDLQQKTFQKL
jgi:hypothetical protein